MGDNTIDMDGTTFDMHFIRTSGSAAVVNAALSTLGSIDAEEVSATGGYTTSGRALTTTWAAGDSAGEIRFDATDLVLTASGANINNIRYAVIVARTGASGADNANLLVAQAALSTAQFTLNSGSTLTVQFNASGIFELA
jgi:hypothetical protein